MKYLRAAICAQTLAGGDIKNDWPHVWYDTKHNRRIAHDQAMLGHSISLVSYPSQALDTREHLLKLDDYTTICKLLMLSLYREHWYDPNSMLTSVPLRFTLAYSLHARMTCRSPSG